MRALSDSGATTPGEGCLTAASACARTGDFVQARSRVGNPACRSIIFGEARKGAVPFQGRKYPRRDASTGANRRPLAAFPSEVFRGRPEYTVV